MKNNKYIVENEKLMKEWDWDKNNILGLDPKKITYGSSIKAWWICEKGHEWESSINKRTSSRGCPICAERRRAITRSKNWIKNKGSLADNNPKLASQWHPTKNGTLTPNDVTVNNGRKVWWVCEKGHEWESQIKSRNNGVGCPICSGHKIVVGYNDLATQNPKLALEWHPTKNGVLTPNDVTVNNGKKVWWICEKGHEWKTSISNRTSGTGCPICKGKKILKGYNDLATQNPILASEWHPTKNGVLTPNDVGINCNKKVWWQCYKGHEWETSISKRTSGTGCPICSSENKTSFPEQAIFFYFSKIINTYNRYRLDNKVEIDIYLPEINVGIEYDGIFFHNDANSEKREKRKNEYLSKKGIYLIRVKESKRKKGFENNILYCKPGIKDKELQDVIKKILIHINTYSKKEFDIDIDINRDRWKIYDLYIESEKNNSLKK